MKFHWFNLMPWPYLPDDFTEKHRSVWVDVDSRLFDPVKANRIYNDYLDLLELAEDVGYDGLGEEAGEDAGGQEIEPRPGGIVDLQLPAAELGGDPAGGGDRGIDLGAPGLVHPGDQRVVDRIAVVERLRRGAQRVRKWHDRAARRHWHHEPRL